MTLLSQYTRPDKDTPSITTALQAGRVVKEAHDDYGVHLIEKEVICLSKLSGFGCVPKLIAYDPGHRVVMQYIAPDMSAVDIDEPTLRESACHLLWALQQTGIQHGDLTSKNIIIRESRVYAIDFAEANTKKRDGTDAYWLLQSLKEMVPDSTRILRRWHLLSQEKDFDGSFFGAENLIDLGCFEGEFTFFAKASGIKHVLGIDRVPRPSPWLKKIQYGCAFANWNIVDWPSFEADVVLFFSTWPYIVGQVGLEKARELLGKIIEESKVLYFETQLAGDGPGYQEKEEDILELLQEFKPSDIRLLDSIPVEGRPHTRAIWRVW